jgi:hypothetical protein
MTVVIANQVLIMDLIFRGAFEHRELEESVEMLGKEILLVNHEMVHVKKMTSGNKTAIDLRPHKLDIQY